MGPSGTGHTGDLPAISISGGKAVNQVLWAPELTVAKVRGHALMIHAGGDNYRDAPKPLGGGAGRAACGVIPS
jgi:Cu-Zn family superoxide dismutase